MSGAGTCRVLGIDCFAGDLEQAAALVVEEARSLLPGHAFEALSDRRWLLRGAA